MSAGVLCAVRGPAETVVVRSLGASGSPLAVTRRCADLAELLAAAAAGLGRVAVVSADLPGLDREAVHHLHGSGVLVVALAEADRGRSADRLTSLGLDAVIRLDDVEADVVGVVAALVAQAEGDTRPGHVRSAHGSPQTDAAPGSGLPAAARTAPPSGSAAATSGAQARAAGADVEARAPSRGIVVAVWGPTGAPGRSTIALNLADELARLLAPPLGRGALLVDADTYGGTIAQMLGLLDEAPGVAAAARAASAGRLDPDGLAALTPVLNGGLRVLTGISRAARWPEVSVSSLAALWSAARALASCTVVDCGFGLEQDEALSYDTRAPHRNAATLSALAEADAVVVVGHGDPIGLQRLVRGLDELAEAGGADGVRHVVVNRVRASASGAHPARAIRDALLRYAGVTDALLVPDDVACLDGAVLAARTLREHAPSSPARRAVQDLAGRINPVLSPARAD